MIPRGFLRSPGFVLAAIASIAIGVGASTAIYSPSILCGANDPHGS
jgi:hypothetical protein